MSLEESLEYLKNTFPARLSEAKSNRDVYFEKDNANTTFSGFCNFDDSVF